MYDGDLGTTGQVVNFEIVEFWCYFPRGHAADPHLHGLALVDPAGPTLVHGSAPSPPGNFALPNFRFHSGGSSFQHFML